MTDIKHIQLLTYKSMSFGKAEMVDHFIPKNKI